MFSNVRLDQHTGDVTTEQSKVQI